MNALQQPRPPLQPIPKPRATPRPRRHLRQRSYQVMALETTAKIGVNLLISAAAISTLTQLLPQHWLQQEKLREIRTNVKLTEERVNKLQSDFSRNFDPRQAKSIMQQQGYRFDPNQRPLLLTNPDSTEAERIDSSP
jgi:hypothetical protein